MKIRVDHYVNIQMMHEMAVLYIHCCKTEKPTKKRFLEYVRYSLTAFGHEYCGHGENGYSDYTEKENFNALDFLYKYFTIKGVIDINYFDDREEDFSIICHADNYKKAPN